MRRWLGAGFILALAFTGLTVNSAAAYDTAVRVTDLNASSGDSFPPWAGEPITAAIGSTAFFTASADGTTTTLWQTDGTTTSQITLPNILTTHPVSLPQVLTPCGTKLYFIAEDMMTTENVLAYYDTSVHYTPDLTTGTNNVFSKLTCVNGTLYFGAVDNSGYSLYSTDGSTDTRHPLNGTHTHDAVGDILDMGSGNYIVAAKDVENDAGYELYSGNASTASRIADLNPGTGNGYTGFGVHLIKVGSTAFFTGSDGSGNTKLFKTSGSTPTLVKDFGASGYADGNFTTDGTQLFLDASDGTHDLELWKSDGTTTTMLTNRAQTDEPYNYGVAGGKDFFSADDVVSSVSHHYIWETDGTTTTRLKQLENLSYGGVPWGSKFLFTALEIGGDEPFISDGTTAGTRQLFDVRPGTSGSSPQDFVATSTNAYFWANDGTHGREIWKTSSVATTYDLTTTLNGTGYLSSSPSGISCSSPADFQYCSATYPASTVVTLTASSYMSHTFVSWSGACSGTTNPCNVTMDQARSVTANFDDGATGSTQTLTVTKSGSGSGTVTSDVSGINCGATCSHDYAASTPVALTASPDTGSLFAGWSGDCTNTTGECDVTMSQARSVTADFEPAPSIAISDYTHKEGKKRHTTPFTFTVTVTGTVGADATVHWATVDGTATQPKDYASNSGDLTFTSTGPASQQVTVTVNGDKKREKNETFTVHLSAPVNATIADADGVGTIKNDDH